MGWGWLEFNHRRCICGIAIFAKKKGRCGVRLIEFKNKGGKCISVIIDQIACIRTNDILDDKSTCFIELVNSNVHWVDFTYNEVMETLKLYAGDFVTMEKSDENKEMS
jgi:hypothetical protein